MATRNKARSKSIDYHYNLHLFFSFLKPYKLLSLGLLLVILFFESTSVVEKFLFKIIIDKGTAVVQGNIAADVFTNVLLVVAAVFVGVSVSRALLRWVHVHLLNILECAIIADLKRKFFNHLLYLSYRFHTTHKTGSLISRLVRGGRAMESMMDVMVFNIAPLIFQLLVVGGSLLYFDVATALIVVLMTILFIAYSYLVQRRQQKFTVAANDAEDREKANIADFLTNIDSIKFFGKEVSLIHRFVSITEQTKKAYSKHWNFYRHLDVGQILILALGTFSVVYFPLTSFLRGTTSLGTLVFIYMAYGNLTVPLYSFVRGMRDFYRVMADFESLFQYDKIENEIKDPADVKATAIQEGAIEFRKVTFRYHRRKLFSNFNLTIPKHHKVALVGHSGSGKTTLVRLLYRFYDLKKGQILIDGINIRDFPQESLRSELSIVPQECVLFDDTIYNNIAFSQPRSSRRQVWKAMKFAQLDTVVKTFPQQENTIVGERGIRLSGGEKQRVSIARAILADKKVLVLDEATSSLDSQTEHEIQKDLARLMRGRTTIIIAHRLSTIMQADTIVVMERGKIVQTGTHAQLITQPGKYKKLWQLQRGGYLV